MKALAVVPVSLQPFVADALTVPPTWAPVVQVSDVELDEVTAQAVPPRLTVVDASNPEPLMVTESPPALGRELGVTESMTGTGVRTTAPPVPFTPWAPPTPRPLKLPALAGA